MTAFHLGAAVPTLVVLCMVAYWRGLLGHSNETPVHMCISQVIQIGLLVVINIPISTMGQILNVRGDAHSDKLAANYHPSLKFHLALQAPQKNHCGHKWQNAG